MEAVLSKIGLTKNESILVMFSGSGIYPLVIAKNTNCREVYGIEINTIAHKYALENIKKNKLENKIKLFLGDVNKAVPKLKMKFDRILMPLPKRGEEFLGLALKSAKSNGIIHFYTFQHEDEVKNVEDLIKAACKKSWRRCKILRTVKCGQYSPRFYRFCADFIVN